MDQLKKDVLIILNTFRHGFIYGFKVRIIHSLVMSILFFRGNLKNRLKYIYKLTKEHSLKLAIYVSLYKFFLIILNKFFKKKGFAFQSFIAGSLGGYFVFKNKSPIDLQVALYLFGRNLIGIENLLKKKNIIKSRNYYLFISTITWGLTMFIFNYDKSLVQSNLKKSMDYLYDDSENINDFKSLLSFK